MAKVNNNMILNGASGMLGNQVVIRRQQNGEYVLAKRPARTNGKASPAQIAQQQRFRKAALYGKAAKGKPEYQALAKERHISAFAVATGDYLTPPTILGIDVAGYLGAAGQVIRVSAVDDVKVKAVEVRLAQDDSTLIEKGQAVVDPQDPQLWVYTSTTAAPSASVAIFVDVTDLAGQVTSGTAHT